MRLRFQAARTFEPVPCHLRLTAVGCAVMAMLVSVPASAQLSDTLHPFVSVGYAHDNNLLRLSDDQLTAFGGDGSDSYRTVMFGISFERPIGRQILTGSARVSRVSYDHYSQFDYNGKDANVDLKWMIGNHLSGHLGSSYSQSLTTFADYHSNERNLRSLRKTYADGIWRFHPSWQVNGSYSEDKYTYDLKAQAFNDRTEKLATTGIDYVASSGSTFGIQFRRLKGEYPNQESLAGTVFYNGYTQDEQKININWAATEVTRVLFLGGWVKRKHDFLATRDDSGTNGRLIVNWQPRERLRFNTQLWREFAATEGNFINSALNKGQLLKGTWDIDAKFSLDAQVRYEKRNFAQFSALGVTLPESALSDSSHSLSSNLTYRPRPNFILALGAFRDSRSGSPAAGTNTYKANGISFNATAQF